MHSGILRQDLSKFRNNSRYSDQMAAGVESRTSERIAYNQRVVNDARIYRRRLAEVAGNRAVTSRFRSSVSG